MVYLPASGPLGAGSTKGLTGSAWYGSLVRPDAPIVQYTAAPPRGMTNPPQNPEVRAALLRDLKRYGVANETPAWPPAPVKLTPVESRCPLFAPPASPRAASEVASAARKGSLGPTGLPSTTAHIRGPRKKGTNISQSMPELDVSPASSRAGLPPLPSKGSPTRVGMSRGPGRSPLAAAGVVMQKQGDVRSLARSAGDTLHRSRDAASDAGGHNEGTQAHRHHHHHHQSPFRQISRPKRVASDFELHDCIKSLRRKGRHLKVSEEARFRSGAAENGKPVVSWSNDASQLSRFHNQAMRCVNPSRLEKLPEDKKKRRKRIEAIVQDDDMQICDSARYHPDTSLRSLRHLRVCFLPGDEEKAKELEAKKIDVISHLKAEMAGQLGGQAGFLKRMRTADLG